MANITYLDGNQGAFRFRNFGDFEITSMDADGALFERTAGSYDITRDAFTIELGFNKAVVADVNEGPDAGGSTLLDGGQVFTGGTISSVTYKNNTSDPIMEVTGLKISLVWLTSYIKEQGGTGDLWELGWAIFRDANAIVGSSDSTGSVQTEDFEDFVTGTGNDTVTNKVGNSYIADRGGSDKYNGGKDFDEVSYEEGYWSVSLLKRGIEVKLFDKKNKDVVTGTDGKKDSLKNIEKIIGSAKDDRFIGDKGNNEFAGLQGADFFDGKKGWDYIEYNRADSFGAYDNVIIDYDEKIARDPSGSYDRFKGIEAFRMSEQDDYFFATNAERIFVNGDDGNDTFNLDGGGIDLFGGDGDETYNLWGTGFYHLIQDFETGNDSVWIYDFTSGDVTETYDGSGDLILRFGVDQASLELEGISAGDVAGAGGFASFLSSNVFFGDSGVDPFPDGLDPNEASQIAKTSKGFKANFQFFDGNQGIFRYQDMDDGEVTYLGDDGMFLEFSAAQRGSAYDPTQDWYRAVVEFDDTYWHNYDVGSASTEGGYFDDGLYSGGHISKITFYSEYGDGGSDGGSIGSLGDLQGDLGFKLLEISDLEIDLAWFSTRYTENWEDALRDIWNATGTGNNTYEGSNFGGGPDSDWDGEDITTGRGNDTVNAGKGGDYISDRGGKDKYNGEAGIDMVSYDSDTYNQDLVKGGIDARLDKGYIKGYDGLKDTVKSIEEVRGTALKDKFKGDNKDNLFQGLGGNDIIDGGKGEDEASYRNDDNRGGTGGIIADMSMGTKKNKWKGEVLDGFGTTDTLYNIERIQGTDYDDSYTDSKGDDYFRARSGEDVVNLSKGNDFVNLGFDGDDDTIIFKGDNWGNDGIWGFDDGDDKLQITNLLEADFFADVAISGDGDGNTVVEWEGNELMIYDFSDSNLTKSDFIF